MKNIAAGEPASSIANPSQTAFRTKHAVSSGRDHKVSLLRIRQKKTKDVT